MTTGSLFLVATPIGNVGDMSPRACATIAAADIVCCEDTRHSGLLFKRLGVSARKLVSLNSHNESTRAPWLVEEMAGGAVVALVSDAGTPAVSDPGERLVALAAAAGIVVSVVPGPSAVLAALVVSGMGLARWRYEGFLPRKGADRKALLREIAEAPCPSVCYESPQRLVATLSDLAGACGEDRAVAVCREMTKLHEEVWRSSLAESITHFAGTPGGVRGEVVVVVGERPVLEAATPPPAAELRSAVDGLVDSGLSRRDSVRQVALELGLARSVVYEAAVGNVPPDDR